MENLNVYDQIGKNKTKTWFIMIGFSIFVLGVAYIFTQALGYDSSILPVVFGFTLLTNLISYFYSDSMVLGLSGAKKVTKEVHKGLFNVVENLCIGAGMPMPKIFIIEDSAPNAFATGRDPKHASIAVTTGLLDKLNKQELEGVIGHELSHIKNYDTRVMVIVSILVGFVALLADWFLRISWHSSRDDDNRKAGGIIILVAVVLSILSPLIAQIIRAAISRRREYLADASSALLTRYPDGLAEALLKISADREPLEVANKATAHLYIANPFKEDSTQKLSGKSAVSWFANLFNTHPPIEDRVRALRAM